MIQITQANIMNINGVKYVSSQVAHISKVSFLKQIYAINTTNNRFIIFQNTVEKRENSIFIFACMRANIEEFKS